MKKITLLIVIAFFVSGKGICSPDTLVVTVYGNPNSPGEFNSMGFTINGETLEYNVYGPTPSIHIAIIDSVSCVPLNNCNNDFGQANLFYDPDGDCFYDVNTIYTCRSRPENFFIYRAQTISSIQSMAHLLDSVGNGHIIIAYSSFPIVYSTMDTAFRNVFQRLGSALIPTMSDTVPFIFVCRKGDAGSIHEVIGLTSNDSIGISMTYLCGPAGIENLNAASFNLYPNPVEDILHMDFKDFGTGEIKIYDAYGNLVYVKKKTGAGINVSTENFLGGIYFISFESMSSFSTKKFIK